MKREIFFWLNFFLLALLTSGLHIQARAASNIAVQPGQCNEGAIVRLADQNWESAAFTTQFLAVILREGYGCRVETVPGTTAATENALAQDDLQIIAEQWSGRSPIIESALDEGKLRIVGDTLIGGAEQGWYVPDYVVHGDPERNIEATAPDLKSWRDLPRYASLFKDPETPGKGRFFNCPTGWVCEATNSRLLSLHGLDDTYTNFRAGTGAALDSAISSAYDRGVPILFYYWQPAGLMAKYRFHKIEQPAFNQACWDTIVSGEGKLCASDFLTARLAIAVSTPFAQRNPGLIDFFEKVRFEPKMLNESILRMNQDQVSSQALVDAYLREETVWRAWVPEDVAQRLDAYLQTDVQAGGRSLFPQWSMTEFVNRQLVGIVQNYGTVFHSMSDLMLRGVLLPIETLMIRTPAWLFLLLAAALAWHATRKVTAALLYTVGLYLIGAVGLWDKLMQTFALVLVSTLFSVIIGIPIGIIAARGRWLRRILTPVLDVMQTLPSFVYLIPVLMLFGLGKVPALFATIIYAVPPLIRLTILGLRQVDPGVMEAAQSCGGTRWQMLTRVTLPLARPSIMAGINQTTMMALGMVVVASMIGARGLGEDVLAGIQTLDVGRGLQAGVAIVILAIVIDRITQGYGRSRRAQQRVHEEETSR